MVAEAPLLGKHFYPVREYLTKTVDYAFNSLLQPDRFQVFVASFSIAEDQLSQWRGLFARIEWGQFSFPVGSTAAASWCRYAGLLCALCVQSRGKESALA